ncbi:MAG: acetoacetate--CoA ligase [Planctomycetes bacterium]|nr:acetoacetate--CoA ligase [Planctomycetota bacterium]
MADDPLWRPTPERVAESQLVRFMSVVEERYGVSTSTMEDLWRWSVDHREAFWSTVWDFGGVRASECGETVLENGDCMPGARWFPNARLNFAENLLRRQDQTVALIAWGENKVRRTVTWAALHASVARLSHALQAAGVGPNDRVAGLLPNIPETVVAMLATASIGAIWSSCSPDFGVPGVLDRFGQISPKVLLSTDGYYYSGKVHMSSQRLAAILDELPTVEHVITIPYVREETTGCGLEREVLYDDFVRGHDAQELAFAQLPFDHPLYIMYSSGTTGPPKCILHGAGGTLLQHLKEHRLHADIRADDRVFYFTTCGWMMWNWLVSALACDATVLLYDGSPFWPRPPILWDMAEQEKMTFFGTGAKYIDAMRKMRLRPADTHDLAELRAVASTGSPLAPESFEFVYDAIKTDVQLASISGGTDIISCFVLGNPTGPVHRGEIQCRGLGMAVDVFDDEGGSLASTPGELVCTRPFPSMPTGFWNDDDGAKYHAAYFDRYDGIWCHGDWVELTERGGMIIYGRSDATLNPGGVRIGTAEIYRQVEQLDEVLESIVVGQDWRSDVRVVLFVRLRDGLTLDDALVDRLKKQIRENTTPRHVPAVILQVADIPRTKSGKITELAVRNVIMGRPVKNREALANPDALDLYSGLPELGG